jgi:hypothetical protein
MSKPKERVIHRDAGTGRIVTEGYAKRHPGTTTREHVPVVKPGKKRSGG